MEEAVSFTGDLPHVSHG